MDLSRSAIGRELLYFMKAFVLATDKISLDLCDAARARQLLDKGKASMPRRYPFAIILKRRVDRLKPKPYYKFGLVAV